MVYFRKMILAKNKRLEMFFLDNKGEGILSSKKVKRSEIFDNIDYIHMLYIYILDYSLQRTGIEFSYA